MKCQKCKKNISIKNVKFCPFCGAELKEVDASNKKNNALEKYDTIKICGENIGVTKYMSAECTELSEVVFLARKIAKRIKTYYLTAGSLEKGTSLIKDTINNEYPKVAESIIEIERKNSFDVDISGEELCDLSSQHIHSLLNLLIFSEAKSLSIDYEKAYNKYKRDVNKDSRTRIIGGGFGIEGAIKGMAIAGAANLTTGAFYSLFNGARGIIDNLAASADRDSCYREIKRKVYSAVYSDIVQLYYYLNYLIERPMIYDFCKEDIYELYERNSDKEGETKAALNLIINYPYLEESFDIAFSVIDDDNALLNYAKKLGSNHATFLLEKNIELKRNAEKYLKKDTMKYIKLFKYKSFFKKAVTETDDIVAGVEYLGTKVNKYFRVASDKNNLPFNINNGDNPICFFTFDNVSIIFSDKGVYFECIEGYMPISKYTYFDYSMKNPYVTNILYENKGFFSLNLDEKEARNLVDCINYILLKLKYNIPKLLPYNLTPKYKAKKENTFNDSLSLLFGQNKEYIVNKYRKHYALELFVKYGNSDIMDVLEREKEKKSNLRRIFKLSCDEYLNHLLILDSVKHWIEKYDYYFENEKIICYLDNSESGVYMSMMFTDERVYFDRRENGKTKLLYIAYKDIRSFDYKCTIDEDFPGYTHINMNGYLIPILNIESSSEASLLYELMLFVILSFKYKSKNVYRRAVCLDRYRNELSNRKDNKTKEEGGCFITSATCLMLGKNDDCYELNMFRKFRDEWLVKQCDGEKLIKEYYKIAPVIVRNINMRADSQSIYKKIWESFLIKCLNFIENKEYDKCKSKYTFMVKTLNEKFGR